MNDNKSLAHTRWNRKYHIVFAPKYRRKIFYEEKRAEIGKALGELCGQKGVTPLEGEVYPDHVHILVEIPSRMSATNLKYEHGNRSFWCRGYYEPNVLGEPQKPLFYAG